MEHHSIEREIHVEASPEVVYEVISTPRHLREWWPDEAQLEPLPGATGVVSFGEPTSPEAKVVPLTVVEADPPRRFSFRWAYPPEQTAASGNSFLVVFDLVPSDAGTLLRFTETGFQDQGLPGAELEQQYREHVTGWDHFLPRLGSYLTRLATTP